VQGTKSIVGAERPEKPQNFRGGPALSRIQSIKSANKRSQNVTLITRPNIFLEHLFDVEFIFRKYFFAGKSIGNHPCTDANFSRFFIQNFFRDSENSWILDALPSSSRRRRRGKGRGEGGEWKDREVR